MDIRIYPSEKMHVTAVAQDGTEASLVLTHAEMLERGVTLIDGLAPEEIEALRNRLKVTAVKMYSKRTVKGILDSKRAVEEWSARNECCEKWPTCEHTECLVLLDVKKIEQTEGPGLLNYTWKFPKLMTEEQARILQRMRGFDPDKFGFFSFKTLEGLTAWSCHREI